MLVKPCPLVLELEARDTGYVWRTMHDSRRALHDVSATFAAGTPHFICGPSGSGKSTLGLLLAGLMKPTEGSVRLDSHEPELQRNRIAYVFQFPETLFFCDTVREELADISESRLPAESSVFEDLGIVYADVRDRNPHLLSEGYARLTAIALQLSRHTDVLILDEPTIGLDWKRQERVIAALRRQSTPDRLVIIITHDLDMLYALGGSTLVLLEGRQVWHGRSADLVDDTIRLKQFGLAT